MRIRVALRAVVVPALLAGLGLAGLAGLAGGCTGDDDGYGTLPSPTASTPTTAAASPSASPTPPPPTMPALARQDSPTGAEAFARFFIQALDYATHTGNTSNLKRLGDCEFCRSQASGIESFYQSGGHIEGGRLTVEKAHAIRHVARAAAVVTVTYSQEDGRSVDGTGKTETVTGQRHAMYALTLRRTAGGWLVTKFQPIE